MSATTKRRGRDPFREMYVVLAVVLVPLVLLSVVWLGATLGAGSSGRRPARFPPAMLVELAAGRYRWPGTSATVATIGVACVLLAALFGIVVVVGRWQRAKVKVDRALPYLAQPHDLEHVTEAGARGIARRLGVPDAAAPGVLIGNTVRGGRPLYGSWEDMHVDIWGPRTGKTATRAIPNICAAPGAVVVTSNKRDIVDATRLTRERRGRVWVFDPQQQAGEPASWYWDPLSYVGDSIVRAVKLAGRFAAINRMPHTQSDGYFEPAAEQLIANLLLACSLIGQPVTTVYRWLTNPTDEDPVRILRRAGHELSADAVGNVVSAPDRQRAGVYGTAAEMMSFLIAPTVTQWVTPGSDTTRLAFDYREFVRSSDQTLYLLSEETNKMAAPLVLAFTAALAEEAENLGIASPGGRLPLPMLFVLDEAANVCPWKALPDKYSHFGSRGVVMMTILQSWAQGVSAWGSDGMKKLWGAANVRVYGGGVLDTDFLSGLSAASGVFEPETTSVSHKATRLFPESFNVGSRPEPVLDVPDLVALPRGRAFVQLSGTPATLVRTAPWWEGPFAAEIRASTKRFDPVPSVK
ncbi:TraM recognition domain-containing protein [Yinghuangia sp. ASG 101]|uniref:type IV secretory system conjugative DNA transfer family protein n=1 Tax=Yinghuangia sp. ASG 101 TaxID=2896848 RepID=UPI001E330AE7|nr:TraM recognition domain-containing protein [Yinghuangia sp. ASG 101]UGQ11381.1 TraM recognition domain-containing protein [Yinghuangia sp. ASG 101]